MGVSYLNILDVVEEQKMGSLVSRYLFNMGVSHLNSLDVV